MDTLKILIIDDDKVDRMNYRRILTENSDFQVEILEADNSKKGLGLWEDNPVDCILLDYNLPDIDGIEVVKIIKNKSYKATPIIMLTGTGSEKIAVRAMKEGVSDYINKTEINSHTLTSIITNAINQLKLETQLILYRDLEDQKRIDEEQYRLKNDFLTNVSHELLTPINAIIGFTELMHDETLGDINQEQKTVLSQVLTTAFHLLQLIGNAIEISEIEAGKIAFAPSEFDLSKAINEVIATLNTLAKEKQIDVTSEIETDIATVYLDPIRFKQIVHNYLSNALKFTPELGYVHIRIKSETATTFRLEVEDSGIGIESTDIKKLFITFQQLDSTFTKEYQGTGLGLSLTKHIVEAQNGEVGASSITGKGSVFYAILPRKYPSTSITLPSKITATV